MPEVPKKPVPQKKVPVPAPKKVEPPPPKGIPSQSEYAFFIHSFIRTIMVELGFRKSYIYKTDSHIFLKMFRNTDTHFSLDAKQYSRTKIKGSIIPQIATEFYLVTCHFSKLHNFHIAILQS